MSLKNYLASFPMGHYLGRGFGPSRPYTHPVRFVATHLNGRLYVAGFSLEKTKKGKATNPTEERGLKYDCVFFQSFDAPESSWQLMLCRIPKQWATAHGTFLCGSRNLRMEVQPTKGYVETTGTEGMMQVVQEWALRNKVNLHTVTATAVPYAQSWWNQQRDWQGDTDVRFLVFDDGSQQLLAVGKSDGLHGIQTVSHLSEVTGLVSDILPSHRAETPTRIDVALGEGEFAELRENAGTAGISQDVLFAFSLWSTVGANITATNVDMPVLNTLCAGLPSRFEYEVDAKGRRKRMRSPSLYNLGDRYVYEGLVPPNFLGAAFFREKRIHLRPDYLAVALSFIIGGIAFMYAAYVGYGVYSRSAELDAVEERAVEVDEETSSLREKMAETGRNTYVAQRFFGYSHNKFTATDFLHRAASRLDPSFYLGTLDVRFSYEAFRAKTKIALGSRVVPQIDKVVLNMVVKFNAQASDAGGTSSKMEAFTHVFSPPASVISESGRSFDLEYLNSRTFTLDSLTTKEPMRATKLSGDALEKTDEPSN